MILQLTLVSLLTWMGGVSSEISCTPGTNIAHPIDCMSYYKCDSDGKPHLFHCLQDQHFNAHTEECDDPAKANCVVDMSIKDAIVNITEKEQPEEIPVVEESKEIPDILNNSDGTVSEKLDDEATTDTEYKEESSGETTTENNSETSINGEHDEKSNSETGDDEVTTVDDESRTKQETLEEGLYKEEENEKHNSEGVLEDLKGEKNEGGEQKDFEPGSEVVKHEHVDEKQLIAKDKVEEDLVKSDEGIAPKLFDLDTDDIKKLLAKFPTLKNIETQEKEQQKDEIESTLPENKTNDEIKEIAKRDTSEDDVVHNQEKNKTEEVINTFSLLNKENGEVTENEEQTVTSEESHGEENGTFNPILQINDHLNASNESAEGKHEFNPFFYNIRYPFFIPRNDNETDKSHGEIHGYKESESESSHEYEQVDHDEHDLIHGDDDDTDHIYHEDLGEHEVTDDKVHDDEEQATDKDRQEVEDSTNNDNVNSEEESEQDSFDGEEQSTENLSDHTEGLNVEDSADGSTSTNGPA